MKKLAVKFINKYHKYQMRDDGKSYIVHLTNVHYLLSFVTSDVDVQVAEWLIALVLKTSILKGIESSNLSSSASCLHGLTVKS